MLFSKNKKHSARVFTATLLPFFIGLLLCIPFLVHAQEANSSLKQWLVIEPLYVIFTVVGWFTSIAVTIFGWAVNPDYISGSTGILNESSVYDMWKLVRDFLNLFFILTLLYTAFTIVFQVAKDYKKTLLSLVLAALFVNFSFPVTRLIIDVTNVPMYYFINQIGTSNAGSSGADKLGSVLSASQLKNILIPNSGTAGEKVDTSNLQLSQLIMAIIFLFIFSITILTLALLFAIRVIALIILLVFSSVGFAASSMPGLGDYSKKWWNGLWQYTLFGPAAALMLFIATQFFKQVGSDTTASQFLQTGIYASSEEHAQFISAMAMFFVPMIMLWMAIGLASSMSIWGAGSISGNGEKFIKWTGRKFWGGTKWVGLHNPASNTVRGAGQGVKQRFNDNGIVKWAKSPSWFETGAKGTITGKGWKKGARTAQENYQGQLVNEKVKKNKDEQVNRSTLLQNLGSGDPVTRQAAALSLAEAGEIRSTQDLTKALKAVEGKLDKNGKPVYEQLATDFALRVIDKAKDGATSGMTREDYAKISDNDAFYVKDEDGVTRLKDQKTGKDVPVTALETLNNKLKKDGNIKVRVEYEVSKKGDSPETRKAIYDDLTGKMSAEDLAKQVGLATDRNFKEYAKNNIRSDRLKEIVRKATEKSSAEIQRGWAELATATPEGNIVVVNERTPRSRTTM